MTGRCRRSARAGASCGSSSTVPRSIRFPPSATSRRSGGPAGSTSKYHIEVDRHPYSVPFQLLGEKVEARFTSTIVEVYYKGRRILSHRRRYDGQPSTVAEHMPSSHRAHAEWTPSRLVHWAEKTGPATGRVVAGVLESRRARRTPPGIQPHGEEHQLTVARGDGSYARILDRLQRFDLLASTTGSLRPARLRAA